MGRVDDLEDEEDLAPSDEDDEDEDLAPLVKRTSANESSQRLESFEIVTSSRKKRQKSRLRNCSSIAFEVFIVALTLGCSATIYILFFQSESPSDLMNTCDSRHIEKLMEQILETSDFCDPDFTETCTCQSPLEPLLREKGNLFSKIWNSTFERNKALVSQFGEEYEVVLVGDSITEHWEGTEFGMPADAWQDVNTVFREEFTTFGGGRVDGVALGIAGDRCGQLLYRLRNGELPNTLDAKAFWLLIGTNDLRDGCSADAISAGNIRIVEEIQSRRPHSKIVLNSILPKSGGRDQDLAESQHWKAASRINQWLECYAETMQNVEFFNATGIFVRDGETRPFAKYYEDLVHPSAAGCRVWARAIIDKVLELIGGKRHHDRY